MNNYEKNIGKNIKDVRSERKLSQEKLAEKCGISNTTLSLYENSKKVPSLSTIAKIAKSLNVSIERLYYGDENNSFIVSAPNLGKKIVNAIYFLWDAEIIVCYDNNGLRRPDPNQKECDISIYGLDLHIFNHTPSICRLILALNEYKRNIETFPDPEAYLNMLLDSVATEINMNEEKRKKEGQEIKNKSENKKSKS